MRHDQIVPAPDRPSAHRASVAGKTAIWSVSSDDCDYPRGLAENQGAEKWPVLYACGNREILRSKCLGLICSVECPGSAVIKALDAIRELRDAGIVVAGGFHSPMEQECLNFLLRGDQPIIVCPARHPTPGRLPPSWRAALDANRLLLVSPFGPETRRATAALAQNRNEFVAALSTAVLVPYASAGGKAETIARSVLRYARPLFMFDEPENVTSRGVGVRPFAVSDVKSFLVSGLS